MKTFLQFNIGITRPGDEELVVNKMGRVFFRYYSLQSIKQDDRKLSNVYLRRHIRMVYVLTFYQSSLSILLSQVSIVIRCWRDLALE